LLADAAGFRITYHFANNFNYFTSGFNRKRLSFLKNSNNSAFSDQQLVALYKRDADIRVLAELYQRHMDLLFAVCLKYLKDPEAAKDAVMGIFEELISKLLKYEVNQFKGWLYMMAKNYCLMQLRTKKHLPFVQDPELMQLAEIPHLNGVFEKEEHLNQLAKCMEALSPDQKKSIQLFYMEEKSYKEIAGITNTEWDRVRSLIQNARRNLKICMDKNISSDDKVS
jgi:RNA polymerase sigma factor (sigma-70 family)